MTFPNHPLMWGTVLYRDSVSGERKQVTGFVVWKDNTRTCIAYPDSERMDLMRMPIFPVELLVEMYPIDQADILAYFAGEAP